MAVPTIMKPDNMTLLQLIDLLKNNYDDETVLYQVRDICLTSTSVDVQKKGMEFLYNNGLYDDLRLLVQKNKSSTDPSIRLWAKVYQLALDVEIKNYNPINIFEKIDQCKVNELELQFLLEFTRVRVHFQMDYYQKAGNLLSNFDQYIQEVDDTYLRKSFRIRYHRIAMIYTLMQNEVLMTRRHGYKLLTLSNAPCLHAESHLVLGKSYTFESYAQAMFHYGEALKIAKEHNFTGKIELLEQRCIPFVSAYYNNPGKLTSTNLATQAYLEITKGNNEKAIELLTQTAMDTPFKLYCLGKAKQDRTILVQAYKEFVHKRNDYFFSRLPLEELKDFFID